MSEDPVKALDEVVCRIDEAVGLARGPCCGWLKRAPMDEILNWLVNNIKPRLLNARHQVNEPLKPNSFSVGLLTPDKKEGE